MWRGLTLFPGGAPSTTVVLLKAWSDHRDHALPFLLWTSDGRPELSIEGKRQRQAHPRSSCGMPHPCCSLENSPVAAEGTDRSLDNIYSRRSCRHPRHSRQELFPGWAPQQDRSPREGKLQHEGFRCSRGKADHLVNAEVRDSVSNLKRFLRVASGDWAVGEVH